MTVPGARSMPRHIAVIMDGNGRWAKQRFLPRIAGHRRGVENVRSLVRACAESGVEFLTLFAFSSENWRRPQDEVSLLMQLFVIALEQEVAKLHANGIRFRVIGDLSPFDPRLKQLIADAEALTRDNPGLTLTVAAVTRMLGENPQLAAGFNETALLPHLSMSYAPEPDLFIRTGGEQRISNFLLWQLAYTELYFTDTLWPDFDDAALALALSSYQQRERRFGRTSEQVVEAAGSNARSRSRVESR
jgi:undecaprenyl diphosphate synthase